MGGEISYPCIFKEKILQDADITSVFEADIQLRPLLTTKLFI